MNLPLLYNYPLWLTVLLFIASLMIGLEFGFRLLGRPSGKGSVDLKVVEFEIVDEIAVKGVRPSLEAAPVQDGDDPDVDTGSTCLV